MFILTTRRHYGKKQKRMRQPNTRKKTPKQLGIAQQQACAQRKAQTHDTQAQSNKKKVIPEQFL